MTRGLQERAEALHIWLYSTGKADRCWWLLQTAQAWRRNICGVREKKDISTFELQETTWAVATVTRGFICTSQIVKWPQAQLREREDAWGESEGHPAVPWWKMVCADGAAVLPQLQMARGLTEPEQPWLCSRWGHPGLPLAALVEEFTGILETPTHSTRAASPPRWW